MKLVPAGIGVLIAIASAPHARVEPPPQSERSDRGVLAVLRRDGVILPFAAFDGNDWSAPWPADLRFRELPITIDAVPEDWWGGWRPDAWQAWLSDGPVRSLAVQSPMVLRVGCGTRIGLRTDYRPSVLPPPVPTEPFPKDGLAVAGGVRVEPIEIVPPSSEGWSALAVALLDDFDRAENREISAAGSNTGWRHPLREEKRRSLPVRIESWYRTPNEESGGTVSWVEAVRSYPPGPDDDGCGLETLVTGWVYHEKGEPRPRAELRARLMYCDRLGASYMLPLGRIRVREASYWIYQLSGYDSEWYAVAELERSKVRFVAEYAASTCR
jgi:hypothetical protein